MIKLNNFLYNDHTITKIVYSYAYALRSEAVDTGNVVDLAHSSFLLSILKLLEKNSFISDQSNRLLTFYRYLEDTYPFFSFTFKGRIKALLRVEKKYNAYIMQYIFKYHKETGEYPTGDMINEFLKRYSDLIAYRLVVSLPKCNLTAGKNKEEEEIKFLYKICNELPGWMLKKGFDILPATNLEEVSDWKQSDLLNENIRKYVKDYVQNPKDSGYQALHLALLDNESGCTFEIQLRTKKMDDFAEIGQADHLTYEKKQEAERSKRDSIPVGECQFFDDAFDRIKAIQEIDLTKVEVNMFTAYSDTLINDQAGLIRGRLIAPHEHLSKFQS